MTMLSNCFFTLDSLAVFIDPDPYSIPLSGLEVLMATNPMGSRVRRTAESTQCQTLWLDLYKEFKASSA